MEEQAVLFDKLSCLVQAVWIQRSASQLLISFWLPNCLTSRLPDFHPSLFSSIHPSFSLDSLIRLLYSISFVITFSESGGLLHQHILRELQVNLSCWCFCLKNRWYCRVSCFTTSTNSGKAGFETRDKDYKIDMPGMTVFGLRGGEKVERRLRTLYGYPSSRTNGDQITSTAEHTVKMDPSMRLLNDLHLPYNSFCHEHVRFRTCSNLQLSYTIVFSLPAFVYFQIQSNFLFLFRISALLTWFLFSLLLLLFCYFVCLFLILMF